MTERPEVPASMGEAAYRAYIANRGGVTFSGTPAPTWSELPREIQVAWEVGAEASRDWLLRLAGWGALMEVLEERVRQDAKWGQQNHAPLYWLGIAGEEFGEVAKDLIEDHLPEARTELIQLAAVAVAAVESLDRNELRGLK